MLDVGNVFSNEQELPVTSSIPTHVPEEQAALFREVLLALEEKQVPYAVSGAFALRHHTGICRFTKDLDLFMTAKTASDVFPYLRACGFTCDVVDPVWLAKARKGEFFVDLITGMSNGVIVVTDSWIERASPAVVHGVKTRVLGPEELVASKIFVAKRERFDGADIAHVIYGTYPSFDWNRELQLVGGHWERLLWSLLLFRYVYPAQTHYVPARIWQKLLTQLQDEIATPHADAPFRGSLVDEKMFAIDIHEWDLDNLLEEKRQARLAQIEGIDGRIETAADNASQGDSQHLPCTS
ncbi:MAG: nucleotidyltransferase [Candidatus Sulfotelmatobacter sp.]